jgi:hypothetical protein
MMTNTPSVRQSIRLHNPTLHHLSLLLFGDDERLASARTLEWFLQQEDAARATILDLAQKHHVVVRALGRLAQHALRQGSELADWAASAVALEHERGSTALSFLHSICERLEQIGRVVVIKSLDHWPDLGGDLDLFVAADDAVIIETMQREFQAQVLERSWGDRLAHKWNFQVPGLLLAVEAHIGRLGQTGEHIALGNRVAKHAVIQRVAEFTFRVPDPADSIILATLQRMYRHFYFRLCDIANAATLVEGRKESHRQDAEGAEDSGIAKLADFDYLRASAGAAGIWPGVATYLQIASDYLSGYRGAGLDLPAPVRRDARFGGEELSCSGDFIRIPILRRAAKLFTMQVTTAAIRGDVPAVLRLSLLPCLGAAAAIEYRMTGSDKGIW